MLFGQPIEVNIADGGPVGTITCAETMLLTDSDADNGMYLPNENHTITLCIGAGAITNAQFVISPALFGHVWDVDAASSLFIYDGPNTGSALIGVYNTATDPSGVNIIATGLCLTFTFVSGPESTGAGFTSLFRCLQPLQPFLLEAETDPPFSPWNDLPHPSVRFCFGDSITATAITQYPLSDASGQGGYPQSDETTNFKWDMGNGTIFQGVNLTTINYTYPDPGGYLVTLIATDSQGQGQIFRFFALFPPRPSFSNIQLDDTLCIGQQTTLTGGILGTDTVGVSPNVSSIIGGGSLGVALYLPDGNNTNYQSSITITDFEDEQLVESGSDIISMCVNMEHSYLGDLEMWLTCPDGTTAIIFDAHAGAGGQFPGGCNGGGTFLGDANDSGPPGVPGIGFNYCFSDNAPWGTICQELAAGNTVPVNSFPPNTGNAMAPGTYTPVTAFDVFVGCPLNGEWTLNIRDNLFIDDGWVFDWSIYFNPDINPSTIYYQPLIVEAFWLDNPDISVDEGTAIIVQPSQPGPNAFTFKAVDEFGCGHDTTLFVYVRPLITAPPTGLACDLMYTLTVSNATAGGTWVTTSRPVPNATEIFEYQNPSVADVTVSDYGFYTFQVTEPNCGYQAATVVDFRPVPVFNLPFVADTILCLGATITFDAGPQPPNSGNFVISWSQDGSIFNNSSYTVTVNQTGQYILNITDVCGSVSDTSNVVAIEIGFSDQAVCGLELFVQATQAPEGSGFWSSNSPFVSFSAPNDLNTLVNATQYGLFEIIYTDDRCPSDGVVREARFVEQPTLQILPEFPDFCVESDSLLLSINVTGTTSGQYFWTVNGATLNTFGTEIGFGPMEFEPLEVYDISVIGFDEFGVCNIATGDIQFVGEWCTYTIPNVITPNQDGQNDQLNIQFVEYFPGAQLRIFNRWGNIVFEQENYDQYQASTGGWVPGDAGEGVYFYELTLPSIRKVETGYLTILRESRVGR